MTNPPVSILRLNQKTKGLERLAYLENAYDVNYHMKMNTYSLCGFNLPKNDAKAKYIKQGHFIEIYDNGERLALFRIVKQKRSKDKDDAHIEVTCMHAIHMLQDKVMFHLNNKEISGHTTADVINYVLNFPDEETGEPKQTDWLLDRCDFNVQIDYSFENMTIYDALASIPKNWNQEYMWQYDTSSYPFKISLLKVDDNIKSEIRSGKNLIKMSWDEDYRDLANKIYALGKGEGINQVNLVNARDLESDPVTTNYQYYIKDDDSISEHGVVESIVFDRSIEQKEYLMMLAKKTLETYKSAPKEYTVQAADIYSVTHNKNDRFKIGDKCRVVDTELGEDITGRIYEIKKNDMTGNPGSVELVIGFKRDDFAKDIYNLQKGQRQTGTISQGATNIFPYTFGENCDPSHPITVNFILPDDLVYVNKCDLYFQGENFRAYEKGAAGGGGTVVSTQSTSTPAGGGTTSSSGGTPTTAAGGSTTVTSEEEYTNYTYVDDSGRDPNNAWYTTTKWEPRIFSDDIWFRSYEPPVQDDGNGEHDSENFMCYPAKIDWRFNGGEKQPIIYLAKHTHPHVHTSTIPPHSHDIEPHVHNIPDHVHEIPPLAVNIPDHEHDLDYGIYEANKSYSGFIVKVDGNTVAGTSQGAEALNIIPYLNKDSNGKVTRGMHTMTITPTRAANQDGLARVTGQIYIQCFVQSRGDYSILNNTSQY